MVNGVVLVVDTYERAHVGERPFDPGINYILYTSLKLSSLKCWGVLL